MIVDHILTNTPVNPTQLAVAMLTKDMLSYKVYDWNEIKLALTFPPVVAGAKRLIAWAEHQDVEQD